MKTALLSIATAVVLLTSTASFATAAAPKDDNRRYDRKDDRRDDRNDKDFNYGFAKNHRVTPAEKARWEAAQWQNDRKDSRRDDRRDDRNDKDFNYGYDKKHRVTPQERARWKAAHRYDNNRR